MRRTVSSENAEKVVKPPKTPTPRASRSASCSGPVLAANSPNPGRFIGEGHADTEPVAPNDSPQNRALNRRVDIILLARVN